MNNENTTIPITRPSSVNIPQSVQQVLSINDNKPVKTESKYPTEEVGLPSKGYFYPENNPLYCGRVEIKMMTAREEDILMSQDLIKSGKALDKLLSSLIVDKNIRSEDILISDKNALFLAVRRLAYGDTYGPIVINCPSCNKQQKITVNLSSFKENEINFDKFTRGQNRFEFELPYSKRVITYKLLTQKDDDAIDAEILSMKKVNKEFSHGITTRFKHIITSVDGNDDKIFIRKFVDEELMSRDSLALRNYIKDNTPDIDMGFDFKCNNENCNEERKMVTPIGPEFFWPEISR